MRKYIFLIMLIALCFLAGCAGPAQQVTLLYTTDTHGRLSSDNEIIGLDRIAAVKKATPDSLLVDAGDYLQGNPAVNLTKGQDAVRLMKMAGYQAAVLGNHEFDFGQEILKIRIAEAEAGPNPLYLISANILNADGTPFARQAVSMVIDGLKIGFFGLTTTETAVQTHPRNVEGLVFMDVLQSAAAMAQRLRAEGCDMIVALTHVGTVDVMGTKSRDIALQVSGIDVIIDGHSHVELNETLPNGTLLVSSGAHARALGKIVLTRQPGSGLAKSNTLLRPADMAGIEPDTTVASALAGIQQEQAALLAQVIGYSPVDLDAEREHIRTRETNFGNLCTDALRNMTGADIAIINGGGIRRSITKGEISKADVIAAIPFADAVLTKSVTGEQLLEILEHAFQGLPAENGGFAQISGLRLTVDIAKPAGKRVISARLDDGRPLVAGQTYTLAVSDFLASGGDGYPVLAKLPALRLFMPPDALLESYLNQMGPKAFEGIKPGRITIRQNPNVSVLPVWRLKSVLSLPRAA